MTMQIADDITARFYRSCEHPLLAELFHRLGTLNRPRLDPTEKSRYHDWVLVRRKGLELGFTDSEYHSGSDRRRWGYGELILTQVYFYSGFGDVQAYTGELPYGLTFSDSRAEARRKLARYESTRHSYRTDTWDVEAYRLTVQYKDEGIGIDRIACRVLPKPLRPAEPVERPELKEIRERFTAKLEDRSFRDLWLGVLREEHFREAAEDREIDLTDNTGVELYFTEPSDLGVRGQRNGLVFGAIKFFRNRDSDSVGWSGPLPYDLSFEDSPESLLSKLPSPAQHSDTALTGYALWHFDDASLHVLYSNVDNRLLRVNWMAPGYWQECTED